MAETPSISEIKKELERKSPADLVRYCLRLCRFKKENKELVAFMLFEEDDLDAFVKSRKEEIDEMFLQVNTSHIFYAKKTIRKILRYINKNIRISGSRQVEAELLIEFCSRLTETYPSYHRYKQLAGIFKTQQAKIRKAIDSLHPDLQYDLLQQIDFESKL